jgi:multiple sugar transport system permease protein
MTERKGKRKLTTQEAIAGYIAISPWILGFIIFTGGPIIASFIFSFCEYPIVQSPKYIGLENYREIFGDELFWKSLKVTSYYALGAVPLHLIIGLLLSVLMNQKVKGINLFRTMYYTPAVVSGVAVAILWRWIFNPDFGVLNYLLRLIGIKGPAWLGDTNWVIPAFIVMSLWAVGGSMIIYLAGLQGIPTQLYEAAKIDGASVLQQFFSITIPMMSPVILFNLVMGIIGSFQIFTQAYVMTGGGPMNASLFYVLYLYRNAFLYFKMGYGSALAWILFIIVLVFTLLIFKSSPMWVYYEGELKGR